MVYNWWADKLNRRISTEYEHALVVGGHVYFAGHQWNALASDASAQLVIETTTDEAHGRITVDFGGAGRYRLYEIINTGDFTTPGSTVTVFNQNRGSTNTSTVNIYYDPTFNVPNLTDGTHYFILEEGNQGGSGLHVGSGGRGNAAGFWDLNSSTTYVIEAYNTSGSAATYSIKYNFHSD
jgi:hypothetical protein